MLNSKFSLSSGVFIGEGRLIESRRLSDHSRYLFLRLSAIAQHTSSVQFSSFISPYSHTYIENYHLQSKHYRI